MRQATENTLLTTGLGVFLFIVLYFLPAWAGYANAESTSGIDPVMYDEGRLRDPCTDFDYEGVIDQVGRDGHYMVIDDYVYKFHPKISFHSPRSKNISLFNFKAGKKVRFIVNDKRELVSVCLMNK